MSKVWLITGASRGLGRATVAYESNDRCSRGPHQSVEPGHLDGKLLKKWRGRRDSNSRPLP